MERSEDSRSRSLQRPYTYVFRDRSKIAISSFMGYLKGKSSTMLYGQFGELQYKYSNREFWCRGYYVDIAGKNVIRIAEYIKNQLK